MRSVHVLACALLLVAPALADEPAPKEAAPPAKDAAPAEEVGALVEGLQSEEAPERLRAATAARERAEEALLAPLVRLVKDEDAGVRLAAIRALGARSDPDPKKGDQRKKAAAALAARLGPLAKNLAANDEHLAVIDALHDLAQPSTIDALLEDIDVHTAREIVRPRLRAVANVPSLEAIDALIDFASKGRNGGGGGQRGLAHEALVYATGGVRRPDQDEWHVWWSKNRKTFDVEAAATARAALREKEKARDAKAKARDARKKDPPTGP